MIVIADTNIKQKDLLAIISICAESDVKCGVFINNRSFDYNNIFAPTIRDMEISDFFKFEKLESNNEELSNIISGKTIMFNGTGGIVGIELCQRLIKLGCQKLIVLERYEAYLNEFLSATFYSRMNTIIKPVLLRGNGNDTKMLEDVFLAHHPNIVIQASLRKFPSLHKLEVSDIEENNYTKNYFLANLAVKYHCEKFVMISTILDSNLNNEICRTLSNAEIYLRKFFKNTNTEFIVVSMPDIAESYGGIVSIINKQVEERKTVVLPFQHGNSLIMSKDSAAELILQSITGGKENFLRRIHDNEGDSAVILANIIKNFAKLYKLKFSQPDLWK
jgi:FlaA1/EpsC-like NDP-sugar epimerase